MTQYICTITYSADATYATLVMNAPVLPDGTYRFQDNDTILVQFVGPGTVSGGTWCMVPQWASDQASPFRGANGTSIAVADGTLLSVDVVSGRWCFFLYFYAAVGTAPKRAHVVRDPELQVGSIPND